MTDDTTRHEETELTFLGWLRKRRDICTTEACSHPAGSRTESWYQGAAQAYDRVLTHLQDGDDAPDEPNHESKRRPRGKTIRLGRLGNYRVTIPSQRCRFALDNRSLSLGWLIVTPLGRHRRHPAREG